MILNVASYKGGVAKTTTGIHLAEFLALSGGKVLLLDNDPNQYAMGYAANGGGEGLAFDVLPMAAAMNRVSQYDHLVIDTEAGLSEDDLENYAQGCDLLIVPTTPEAMPVEGVGKIAAALAGATNWRILLTIVPPPPSREGQINRQAIIDANLPIFKAEIPRAAAFNHASKAGKPAYTQGTPGRRAWKAYERVGLEIQALLAEGKQ